MRYLFLIFMWPTLAFADDRVPLEQDEVLERGLLMVAEAHFIRKNCDEVSLRTLRGLGLYNRLIARGRELGYSSSEMRAYVDDNHKFCFSCR